MTKSSSRLESGARGRRPLRIGDVVVVPLGGKDQDAVVIEDFGPLGDEGEQLVRLMVLDGPVEYRVPASLVHFDAERAERVKATMAEAAKRELVRSQGDDD